MRPGPGPGLAHFPGGSGAGAGHPSASLAPIYTRGRRAGATHAPHRPRRPLQTARPSWPEPGGGEILAPRWAFEGKKVGPSESRGCPRAVPSVSPTIGGGRLSSLMLCCLPALGKRYFCPLQPGLGAISAAFSGVFSNQRPLPPAGSPHGKTSSGGVEPMGGKPSRGFESLRFPAQF